MLCNIVTAINPNEDRPAVVHVALNPVTGPWSVMRELAKAQAASGMYAGVFLGIIADNRWPDVCHAELKGLALPYYFKSAPRLFGTASFVYQGMRRSPIDGWIDDIAARTNSKHVIVHFHNAWMSGVFLPLRQKPGVKVLAVATFHGVNANLEGKPVRHFLHRCMAARLARSDAAITSVDRANLPLAEELFSISPERFTVIPNGTSCPGVRGCSFPRDRKVLTVGHVGMLSERKGWRITADAVAALAAEGMPIRLIIAGAGPDESAVRDFVSRHETIAEYVGFVSNPQTSVMNRLDILAVMSAHEGMPMSIVEAMSVGIPVIATSVGGIGELVANDHSGVLVPRTVEALSGAIRELYRNPDQMARLGDGALERFMKRFEIGMIAREYDRFYKRRLEHSLVGHEVHGLLNSNPHA